MSSSKMRKAMAAAEAQQWDEANDGWDAGMKPIDGRKWAKFEGGGHSGGKSWWPSQSEPEGSPNALGLSNWADGWESKLDKAAPAADSCSADERLEWQMKHAPAVKHAAVELDEDGCERFGNWVQGELSHKQMAQRAAWEKAEVHELKQPNMRMLFDFGCKFEWEEMPKKVAKQLAQQPKVYAESTWVLSDKQGMKKLLWAEAVRCKSMKKSVEKGAKVLQAELGWKSSKLDVRAAKQMLKEGGYVEGMGCNEPSEGGDLLDAMAAAESQQWEKERLQWRMSLLSERQRKALILKAAGLGRKQIAAELGCGDERVKELLSDGRKRMRAALG